MKKGLLLFVAAAVASVAMLRAQAPSTPTFDVAAIKQNKSGETGGRLGGPPSNWMAVNVPVLQLIVFAYDVLPFQIDGGPDWIRNERYDINAKADRTTPAAPAGVDLRRPMLRALLEDRFKLSGHKETRQSPVYELVAARTDNTPGPELHKSDIDCSAALAAFNRGQALPTPRAGTQLCAITTGPGRIVSGTQPMERLAQILSGQLQRVVLDRTGFKDNYDFVLTFAPDQAANDQAPSLFTALQEQLGVKLEAARGPVQVLVIDHIERATED
jgi:uncharacterized protein (TIGR03435 family)